MVVGSNNEEEEEEDDEDLVAREETSEGLVLPRPVPMKRVLLSQEAADILEKGAAKGSLGETSIPILSLLLLEIFS